MNDLLIQICRSITMPTKERDNEATRKQSLAKKIRKELREGTNNLPDADTKLMRILLDDIKDMQKTLEKYGPGTFLSDDTEDALERIAATDKLSKAQRDLYKLINHMRARTALMQVADPTSRIHYLRFAKYLTDQEREKIRQAYMKRTRH